MVEQLICNHQVVGSNPTLGSIENQWFRISKWLPMRADKIQVQNGVQFSVITQFFLWNNRAESQCQSANFFSAERSRK